MKGLYLIKLIMNHLLRNSGSDEEEEMTHSPVYKLIFIDVDGVLNTTFTHHGLCPILVDRLAELVRMTGSSLVLSSAWRLSRESREHVKKAFLEACLPMPISCTPLLEGLSYKYTRLEEITGWLRYNTTNIYQSQTPGKGVPHQREFLSIKNEFESDLFTLPTKITVSHFISLDDIDLRTKKYGGDYHRILTDSHFVRILARTGLSENNVREAMILLGSKESIKGALRMNCEICDSPDGLKYQTKENKYFCGDECALRFNHIEIPYVFSSESGTK